MTIPENGRNMCGGANLINEHDVGDTGYRVPNGEGSSLKEWEKVAKFSQVSAIIEFTHIKLGYLGVGEAYVMVPG